MVKKKKVTKKIPSKNKSFWKDFARLVKKPSFQKYYFITTCAILLVTTIIWSLLSARVHDGNADQIVNPYMFESGSTFKNALFPSQHTYLLKWPLFLAVHIFGSSTSVYHIFTVLLCVATVGLFAFVLYRIERRPLVIGTLLLALSSVLLLIPAQPYPGGLLPVNMGMISNRNIEYVLYIFSLYALVRTRKIKSAPFIIGATTLALLAASDKLFLIMTVGASLLACVSYASIKKWHLVSVTIRWFFMAITGAFASIFVIAVLSGLKITHIPAQTGVSYGLINSLHSFVLAVFYACTGMLTNFGANPAMSTTYMRQMPSQTLEHLLSFAGPAYIINILICITSVVATLGVLLHSFGRKKVAYLHTDRAYRVSLFMTWSSFIAIASFIFTNHYYAGDARYMSILLFTAFIGLASFSRTRECEARKLVISGAVIAIALLCAVPSVFAYSHKETSASSVITQRNQLISQALASHPVNILVGDYWRVMPIKQIHRKSTQVLSLGSCLEPNSVLTSLSWQPNLQDTSFAYLLSLDKSKTNYPQCTEEQIVTAYGKPNANVVIAGTLDNPKEMLLFYDHGIHKSAQITNVLSNTSSTTHPIDIEDLVLTNCESKTVMNIVAHEDDDLLFINPDIQNEIKAGNCVRTIYITAGDAGSNSFYWLSREQGSEAAYSEMLGADTVWIQRTVKLSENRFVTIANPKNNSKVSLVFFRLPDGNLHGQGFRSSRRESLSKLFDGRVGSIRSMYGDSIYSKDDLTNALESFMHLYKPAQINAQNNQYQPTLFPDHSDHIAASNFADSAHALYEQMQFNNSVSIPIRHYLGYPVRDSGENVEGDALAQKTAAFLRYAQFDGGVCQSEEQCTYTPTYGSYLRRQYAID